MSFSRRRLIGYSKELFYSVIKFQNFRSYFHKIRKNLPQKVIYTCITANYDCLILNVFLNPEYKYVCFTDNKRYLRRKTVGPWQIEPLRFTSLDDTRNSRWHKMHPHELFPEYKSSIFIDANVLFKNAKLFEAVEQIPMDVFLSIPPHRRRNCIYDELECCIKTHKDKAEILEKHKKMLIAEGFPKNMGMTESNIIFRRHHHPLCIKIMHDWWTVLCNYSRRDQLSLFYVLWKNNTSMTYLFDRAIKDDKASFRIFHHNNI